MRKLLLCLAGWTIALGVWAQEYPQLGAKLDEYFTALSGESAEVQNAECDYIISSCTDSLVRQFVALKIYDHYLHSKIMGDDAVAVHVAQEWFLSGKVAMREPEDLLNAKVFVAFNESSLIGEKAPSVKLQTPEGRWMPIPVASEYAVLYFYDTSCSTCKITTTQLRQLMAEEPYSQAQVYAIYTGSDASAWEAYRSNFDSSVIHLWDPEVSSDWQRLYGVLQTPRMFLVSPFGIILGRGLDVPALRMLLDRELGSGSYSYGEAGQMDRYQQLFAAYGDTLKSSHVMDVADYLAARTMGEGDMEAFKQVEGDLLYFLSSRREEPYRDAIKPFVERYIHMPDVWTTEEDQLQVVALADFLLDLTSRTPVGSEVPDLTVPGVLRRKPCLFAKDGRAGNYALRKLRGRPGYVVFYTGGCSSCQATLSAVEQLVSTNRRARVLLVDVDAILNDQPALGQQLLDSFDLSALPFVLELDRKGVVQHRYVQL